jgi:hypothetical protein
MKPLLILALGLELTLAWVVASQMCFLRADLARAIRDAHGNPSSETLAELKRQQSMSLGPQIGFGGFLFALMAVPTVAQSRKRRSLPRAH